MGRHWHRATWRSAVVLAVAVVIPVASGFAAAREVTTVPAQLVGSWSRNVTQANYNKYGSQGGFIYVGVWTMTIKKTGGVDFFPPGSYVPNCKACAAEFTAPFSFVGSRLTVAPSLDHHECTTKGVYAWNVSGRALTLKAIADKQCGARVALLTGVWKRK